MRYRSKPQEVEAMQWDAIPGVRDGYTPEDIVAWVTANGGEARYDDGQSPAVAVRTANGWSYIRPGGFYVVKGEAGFYTCDPEMFERRWEPLSLSTLEA